MDIPLMSKLLEKTRRPDDQEVGRFAWRKISGGSLTRKEGYIFAAVVLSVILYYQRKLHHMEEHMEIVGEISYRLLDESWQAEVDETFEDIVENGLTDLDDS